MYLKFNNDNHIVTYRIYLFLSPFTPRFFSFLLANGFTLTSHSFYESILCPEFEFGKGKERKGNLMLM